MVPARADGAEAEKRLRSQMQAMAVHGHHGAAVGVAGSARERPSLADDRRGQGVQGLVGAINSHGHAGASASAGRVEHERRAAMVAGNATKGLNVTAQYWELLTDPGNPLSRDYGFSEEQMEQFGATEGKAVYASVLAAAERGVPIRILQHKGFFPSFDAESEAIAAGRPIVQNRTLLLTDWWGSGIVHSKLWMAKREDAYLGSANNDWKSLTQVKEVGVYFTSCPTVVKLLEGYFNNFWTLTSLNVSHHTSLVWDQQWQLNRTMPCWSHFVDSNERCLYVSFPLPKSFIACGSIKAMMSLSPLLDVETAIPEIHCNITCVGLSHVV